MVNSGNKKSIDFQQTKGRKNTYLSLNCDNCMDIGHETSIPNHDAASTMDRASSSTSIVTDDMDDTLSEMVMAFGHSSNMVSIQYRTDSSDRPIRVDDGNPIPVGHVA